MRVVEGGGVRILGCQAVVDRYDHVASGLCEPTAEGVGLYDTPLYVPAAVEVHHDRRRPVVLRGKNAYLYGAGDRVENLILAARYRRRDKRPASDPANEPSLAIPRKLGFTEEATLRRRLEYREGGSRRDVVLFSMFRDGIAGTPVASAAFEAYDAIGARVA